MILIKTYSRKLIRDDNMDDDNETWEVFRTILAGDYIIIDYLNKEYREGLNISVLEDRPERKELREKMYNSKREDG